MHIGKTSLQRASGAGIIARLNGQYLDTTQCEVRWSHDDQQTVGRTTVATVKVVIEYLLFPCFDMMWLCIIM